MTERRGPEHPQHDVRLDLGLGRERTPRELDPDRPFEIVVLGDFSGSETGGPADLDRPLHTLQVDRDDIHDVIARVAPRVRVEAPGAPAIEIGFASVWDFEPSELYGRLAAFRELERRAREAVESGPEPETPLSAGLPATGAGLLDQVLGASGAEPAAESTQPGDLQDFIDRALAGHLIPDRPDERTRERILEAAAADLLRTILHDPGFQAVEALWRGVDLLCRGWRPARP